MAYFIELFRRISKESLYLYPTNIETLNILLMFCSKDKKSIYKSQIFEQFSQTRQTLKCWKKTSILPGKEFNQLLFALTRLDFFPGTPNQIYRSMGPFDRTLHSSLIEIGKCYLGWEGRAAGLCYTALDNSIFKLELIVVGPILRQRSNGF